MKELLTTTDEEMFVKTYFNELIRTYSGVWGVMQVHDEGVFDRVKKLSATVAAHPDSHRVITDLLSTPPGELYDALASGAVEDVTALYCAAE